MGCLDHGRQCFTISMILLVRRLNFFERYSASLTARRSFLDDAKECDGWNTLSTNILMSCFQFVRIQCILMVGYLMRVTVLFVNHRACYLSDTESVLCPYQRLEGPYAILDPRLWAIHYTRLLRCLLPQPCRSLSTFTEAPVCLCIWLRIFAHTTSEREASLWHCRKIFKFCVLTAIGVVQLRCFGTM